MEINHFFLSTGGEPTRGACASLFPEVWSLLGWGQVRRGLKDAGVNVVVPKEVEGLNELHHFLISPFLHK